MLGNSKDPDLGNLLGYSGKCLGGGRMLGKWGALGVSQQEAETMGGLDLRTLHSHLSGSEQGISVLRVTQLHSQAMPGVQSINS